VSPLPVLMYHFLVDGQHPYQFERAQRPYVLTADKFCEHLRCLHAAGYQTVSLSDYAAWRRGKSEIPPRPLIITFDDGHVSCHALAYEALLARGMTATVFLTTERVGDSEYVTWEMVQQMAANGMEFGSHGASHRALTALSEDELETELATSRAALGEHLPLPHAHFALPFGLANPHVIAGALRHYETVCTSDFGINDLSRQPRQLKRIAVQHGPGADRLLQLLDRHSPVHWCAWTADLVKRPVKRLFLSQAHRRGLIGTQGLRG